MKKKNKLDSIYNEISAIYNKDGNIDSEKIQQDIETLNREIEACETEIENKKTKLDTITNDEGRKNVQALIEKAESRKKVAELRKQNLEGYMKYGEQIEKIKNIKATWVRKVQKMEQEQEKGKQNQKDLEKELQTARQEYYKKLKIKNSPNITAELTNNQYNKLLSELEDIEHKIEDLQKKVEEQKIKNENMLKKITDLKFKIGKSDLAWKTLFTNKGWDEIQRRSIGTNRSFTKKTEKSQEKTETKPEEENAIIEPKEKKQLVPVKNKSLMKRFTEYFKNIWNKIVKKESDKVETVEDNNTGSVVIEQDSFLERLRFHVDPKYKEATTIQKEQNYIKAHESQDKEEKEI